MMINRRAFVAGTALLAVAPACGLLPLDAAADLADVRPPVFMINGWSAQTTAILATRFGSKSVTPGAQLGDSWRRSGRCAERRGLAAIDIAHMLGKKSPRARFVGSVPDWARWFRVPDGGAIRTTELSRHCRE